ncbi:protein transport protein sec31-like [Homarus americanus]|uniref:protein transport protein sec31-like n=1 Tax=Homarus americanus TaxID=6706 RepID=UPI001C43AB79|nr:protein transport protein sec31-like [Homarus americanus]
MLTLWLLCVVSGWGASQHLSRVPSAQVSITNPGERGLIPAQPYWPPTPSPTHLRPPAALTKPLVVRHAHAHAHLNEIESGVSIQEHGYRRPPAGVSKALPTVVLDALNAAPEPPHVDEGEEPGTPQQAPALHPPPISTVTHLPHTISSLPDDVDLPEGSSVTSEATVLVQPLLRSPGQSAVPLESPEINSIQSHVAKTLQASDPPAVSVNQSTGTQRLSQQYIQGRATTVVTTTDTPVAAVFNNNIQTEHNPLQQFPPAPGPLTHWNQSIFGSPQVTSPAPHEDQRRQYLNSNFVVSQFNFKDTSEPTPQLTPATVLHGPPVSIPPSLTADHLYTPQLSPQHHQLSPQQHQLSPQLSPQQHQLSPQQHQLSPQQAPAVSTATPAYLSTVSHSNTSCLPNCFHIASSCLLSCLPSNTSCLPSNTSCLPSNTSCLHSNTSCLPQQHQLSPQQHQLSPQPHQLSPQQHQLSPQQHQLSPPHRCLPSNTSCLPSNTSCLPINISCLPSNISCLPRNTSSSLLSTVGAAPSPLLTARTQITFSSMRHQQRAASQ